VIGHVQHRRFRGGTHLLEPLLRDAVTQQRVVIDVANSGGRRRRRLLDVHVHRDLHHRLADLHELRGAGDGCTSMRRRSAQAYAAS
jgi:hypothetical protein